LSIFSKVSVLFAQAAVLGRPQDGLQRTLPKEYFGKYSSKYLPIK